MSLNLDFLFVSGNTTLIDIIDFRADMSVANSDNVETFDVYINDNYYGSDVEVIQITTKRCFKD